MDFGKVEKQSTEANLALERGQVFPQFGEQVILQDFLQKREIHNKT